MSSSPNRPLSFVIGLTCLILYFILSGPLANVCALFSVIFLYNAGRKE